MERPVFYLPPLTLTRSLQSMLCTVCDIAVLSSFLSAQLSGSKLFQISHLHFKRYIIINYLQVTSWHSRLRDTVRPIYCLCVSFQAGYCDFVLFAEVHSAPAVCSAYGPVRVLCSVKMVALQRAYSVAFIFLYTMQQLTNSPLAEHKTKAHS
jgi:hypothetical protein